MPIDYDLSTDIRYNQGIDVGRDIERKNFIRLILSQNPTISYQELATMLKVPLIKIRELILEINNQAKA